MQYETIFKSAFDTASARISSGQFVPPDETICVVCSKSGKLFTGISRQMNMGGSVTTIHAEIEAIQQMISAGESSVEALLLINTMSRVPMIPCNGCMAQIVSLDQGNTSAQIMLQDRVIPISEIGNFTGANSPLSAAPVPSSPYSSVSVPQPAAPMFAQSMNYGGTSVNFMNAAPLNPSPFAQQSSMSRPPGTINMSGSKGSLLKNKVDSLMEVVEDDDDDADFLDEEEEDAPKKKKRFGLFGRSKKQ